MPSVTQRAVPIHAAAAARKGDPRALLAIPEARADLPRLIARDPAPPVPRWCRIRNQFPPRLATEFAGRKAITAAKTLMADRIARREARVVAEAARKGQPGRVAAERTKKQVAEREAKEAETRKAVLESMRGLYRKASSSWAGGNTTNHLTFGPQASARGVTTKVWSKNGKWSGQDLDRYIQIQPDWLDAVKGRGLDVVDGLLTTHAELVETTPGGVEVYRAAWVRQTRGLGIESEGGFIARQVNAAWASVSLFDLMTFHGSTARGALAGLRRKLTIQGIDPAVLATRRSEAAAKRAARAAAQIGKLVSLVSRWDLSQIGHVCVTRRDSLQAGNCVPGTDEFIERFFPGHTEATISQIAQRARLVNPTELTGDRLTLARQIAAACLVAVRRDKQALRALAV